MRPRLLTVLVPGSMAVLLGVQLLLAALDGPRASAPGLFSVRLPSGWAQSPPPRYGQPDRDHPDTGALALAGPSGRRMEITWTDGQIAYGFNATAEKQEDLPVTVAGAGATLTSWITVDDFNGGRRAAVAMLESVSRRVHGRSVSFAAYCAVGPLDGNNYGTRLVDDWSWCIGILSSWRWETPS